MEEESPVRTRNEVGSSEGAERPRHISYASITITPRGSPRGDVRLSSTDVRLSSDVQPRRIDVQPCSDVRPGSYDVQLCRDVRLSSAVRSHSQDGQALDDVQILEAMRSPPRACRQRDVLPVHLPEGGTPKGRYVVRERGAFIPGFTEEQRGFSALLREGDQAHRRGRLMTAVSHVPPGGHAVRQRLVFEDGGEAEKQEGGGVLALVRALEERQRHLEGELDEQAHRIDAQTHTIREQAATIMELQVEIEEQRVEQSHLQAKVSRQAASLEGHAQTLVRQGEEQRHLESIVEDSATRLEDLGRQLGQLREQAEEAHHEAQGAAEVAEAAREDTLRAQHALGKMVEVLETKVVSEPQPICSSTPGEGESGAWSRRATGGSEGCSPELISSFVVSSSQTPEGPRPPPEVRYRVPKVSVGESFHTPPSTQERSREGTKVKVNQNSTKLPEFAGKAGESLQSFLNKLSNGARLGNWTQEYKAGQLYAQLTGGALRFADQLPDEDRGNFDRLVAALKRQYEGALAKEQAREGLRMIRRGRSETLEALGQRIHELVRVAYPGEDREAEGVFAFRNAVTERLSDVIVTQGYSTVQQCVEVLAKLECSQEHRHRSRQAAINAQEEPEVGATGFRKSKSPPVEAVRAVKDAKGANLEGLTEEVRKMLKQAFQEWSEQTNSLKQRFPSTKASRSRGPTEQRGGPSKQRPCSTCGSPEHWRSECPQKKDQKSGKATGLDPGSEGQSEK